MRYYLFLFIIFFLCNKVIKNKGLNLKLTILHTSAKFRYNLHYITFCKAAVDYQINLNNYMFKIKA